MANRTGVSGVTFSLTSGESGGLTLNELARTVPDGSKNATAFELEPGMVCTISGRDSPTRTAPTTVGVSVSVQIGATQKSIGGVSFERKRYLSPSESRSPASACWTAACPV